MCVVILGCLWSGSLLVVGCRLMSLVVVFCNWMLCVSYLLISVGCKLLVDWLCVVWLLFDWLWVKHLVVDGDW